ncbi:YaiI/YqxD family protein [Anaerovibrio lipolyticus]|uniref:YaiI/YqxD family protein n=1 Tax=Anaerovibrio lipolyticus TaxID=82374 RepID=UPI0026EBDFA6|nr:YaiI/YqxD family protein [Anaerovibrio lipolyticus]MBE6105505.1 YaiI/YqxD family protein [Anaerovibrio lipolyticus]
MPHIYVDADACPVVKQIENVAKSHNIPVNLFCDTNHVLKSDYSEVKIIGAGADAVDFALVNSSRAGDIVVTQDYGVAAMALARGAYAINQDGWLYTNENTEGLLAKRHFIKKMRNATHKHHLKGPRKRTDEDDEKFTEALEQLLDKVLDFQ